MSLWKLIKRSLGFYWRSHLGVLLAVAMSTAVLTGALVVGDSMRHSLRMMVTTRLGRTKLALVGGNRFFRSKLANEIAVELNTTAAAVLQLRALISNSNGTRRANRIEVLGVDREFYEIGTGTNPFGDHWSEGIVLNEALAEKLAVGVGDEVVLRIERPGVMSREVPLAPDSDLSMAFRLMISAVAAESEFGRFGLQANHIAPLNAYVPLEWLQEKLGRSEQANTLLVADNDEDTVTIENADEAILECRRLDDVSLKLRPLQRGDMLEIRSSRIFISESLASAAVNAGDGAVGILTYFVNELRSGERTTPYSIVTAAGKSADLGLIPSDMTDDEIVINQWLADDLEAQVGDLVELTYFVIGPMRKLQEQESSFRIREIIPMDSPAVDPELMPDFPGLAEAENCRDWDPGIEIDLDKIRKRDEDYWDNYRGAPKAFVTLSAGRRMWANRYGSLTAVRYPLSTGANDLERELLEAAEPFSLGLYFQPVREQGLRAGDEGTDFSRLFLSLSMFLIMAALLLTGLLFVFGVENRSEQTGMLLALGFSPGLVKRLLLIEGAVLAALGAAVGTAAGLLYTKVMIYGLATIWQVAVSGSAIHFCAQPSTLFVGAFGGVAISLMAMWLTLRKQMSYSARELLSGNTKSQFFGAKAVARSRIGLWIAALAAAAAVLLLVVLGSDDSGTATVAFFGAGTLVLIGGLGLSWALLGMAGGGFRKPMATVAGLGLRNSTRRSGRSLTVVGLLACGVFLVVAVAANRKDPLAKGSRRDSGTGGFALFGESTIDILHDLNSESGRKSLGLGEVDLEGIKVVQMRVRDGDDASCFNLNRAQQPRLLGVDPERLRRRGAFKFVDAVEGPEEQAGWDLLEQDQDEGVVPAVGDHTTIEWALGKKLGEELEYTDEQGGKFKLRLVGKLNNSILQGSLVISDGEFIKRFPSEDGYRMFLIDAESDKAEAAARRLSAGLRDFGLEVTPTVERLAAFNAVENTYLSIFGLLGGLGMVLGSVGLGLVVLRNVLDRRGELAILRAVGFNRGSLKWMVVYEHAGLMAGGLACGVIAALAAVSPVAQVPYFSLMLTIGLIGVSGMVWIWIATVFALSGKLIGALRSE